VELPVESAALPAVSCDPPAPQAQPVVPSQVLPPPVVPLRKPSAAASTAATLGEEAALLARAFRELRAGDLAACSRTVADHSRRFPHGELSPEAEKLRESCVRNPAGPSQLKRETEEEP
jgi:hypothetical protein